MKRGAKREAMTWEALELVAARFGVLAEPMRLRILQALGGGERTVTELVGATGAGQANVSRHLRVLMDAGMVARRRAGLNAYYRIDDPGIFELCDLVCRRMRKAHEAAAARLG
ncbi:MAG: helix-turn-helix transcriptional regulator [Verrucomicrobiae bacterium]|nr:helix-turn-helix transcriptional regulator [Verrucomicrobiae bacterium]